MGEGNFVSISALCIKMNKLLSAIFFSKSTSLIHMRVPALVSVGF